MRVLLVGDVHGDFTQLQEYLAQIRSLFRIGAAIQVGDFGFFEKQFLILDAKPPRFPVPLHVIDGNHEDHFWLRKLEDSGVFVKWKEEYNLHYQSRGSVLNLGSSRIGFIGGALNVDQPQRHDPLVGSSNFIRDEDTQRALISFNAVKCDLIVSHSCPSGIGIGIPGDRSFQQGVVNFVVSLGLDPGSSEDCGDVQLTTLWSRLNRKPKAWVFGHFHREHESLIDDTFFRCLNRFRNNQIFPVVFWDTEEQVIVSIAGR